MGLGAACFSVGVILGPILGGVLTQKLTWRWCFWINLPPGAITLAVIFFFCKPHPPGGGSVTSRIRSLDLVGCFIFVPTIFMLLLALEMGQYDWNSPNIIGLFVGSGVMVILFVAWEGRKGIDAMLPGIVVARRTVICTVLFAFCHMGSLQVATYYLPEWFQAVRGLVRIISHLFLYFPISMSFILCTPLTPPSFLTQCSFSLPAPKTFYNRK
jgi:MFS family permease